jgi:hypothetical protein
MREVLLGIVLLHQLPIRSLLKAKKQVIQTFYQRISLLSFATSLQAIVPRMFSATAAATAVVANATVQPAAVQLTATMASESSLDEEQQPQHDSTVELAEEKCEKAMEDHSKHLTTTTTTTGSVPPIAASTVSSAAAADTAADATGDNSGGKLVTPTVNDFVDSGGCIYKAWQHDAVGKQSSLHLALVQGQPISVPAHQLGKGDGWNGYVASGEPTVKRVDLGNGIKTFVFYTVVYGLHGAGAASGGSEDAPLLSRMCSGGIVDYTKAGTEQPVRSIVIGLAVEVRYYVYLRCLFLVNTLLISLCWHDPDVPIFLFIRCVRPLSRPVSSSKHHLPIHARWARRAKRLE